MSYVSLHNIVVNPDYTDAWMAGLFDGEGSIGITQRGDNDRHRVTLSLQMTDFDVVEQFFLQAGGGVLHTYPGTNKPCRRWTSTDRFVINDVLIRMLPWLGERRQTKAAQAIESLSLLLDRKECSSIATRERLRRRRL